jgi:hypothetical protein
MELSESGERSCAIGESVYREERQMRKGSVPIVLALLYLFAGTVNAGVVTYDDNWGDRGFNVISETPSGMEIVYSLPTLHTEAVTVDDETMYVVTIPGPFLPNDEGAPNLPGAGRYIAIPQGASARVTIVGSRTEVYHDVNLAPAPPIPFEPDDSPPVYWKDPSIYEADVYYPAEPVKLSDPMKLRGVDVVILGITPFQYNPVSRDLVVYKDLRVRVEFVGGNGHFGEDRLRSRWWEPVLENHLLNYPSLPQIDFYGPARFDGDGYEYVIIVPDDPVFIAWGDTIKAWRKLQGISTEVFTTTQLGGNTVQAIETFVDTAYSNWQVKPVAFLLLSDYQNSGRGYGITSPVWDGYCVSDNIYADVDGDDLPELNFARITAQNGTHLQNMVGKLLSYERDPTTDPGFYDHPLVACGWQTSRWFQLCSEVIRGFCINELGKDPAREYNVYSGTPYAGCPWSSNENTYMIVDYFGSTGLGYIPDTNPYSYSWWDSGSTQGVIDAINTGAFMVQHRDHGYELGWGEPDFDIDDLAYLTNDTYPFVFSINCLTGMYDWYDECFAEAFHRMEHGALGLIAASEVSYSFVNDTYVWGYFDCLWPEFMPDYPLMDLTGYDNLRPGFANASGKYFLEASGWPYNPGAKVITYHLFHMHGDAFTTLYSEVPQNLTVSHDPSLPAGQDYFEVTANDSSIIALTVDGEIIGVAEGTGAPVSMSIPPQPAGKTMLVTVTKANYFRYEAQVPVVPATVHDVGVSSIDSPPAEVAPDTQYPVQATVTNYGGYEETFDVVCTIDGYSDTETVTLSPGDSIQVTFEPWISGSCGDSYIQEVTTHLSGDEDPGNDTLSQYITVVGVHDVGVVSIDAPPDTVDPNTGYVPKATVKNFGECEETFDVTCTIDGYSDTETVTLRPGGSYQVSFASWTSGDCGESYTQTVTTHLDGDENPGNDILSKPIVVDGAHDAGVVSIDAPPDTVDPNTGYIPKATVMNYGECEETFDVICTIDGYSDTETVTLGPGGSLQVSFASWTSGGAGETYTQTVTTHLAGDENPGNDILLQSITVIGIHDVGVVSIDAPPDTVSPCSEEPVMATVRNYGDYDEDFTVTCTINGYSSNRAISLHVGETQQVVFDGWTSGNAGETYLQTVSTTLAGDENPENDDLTHTIVVHGAPHVVVALTPDNTTVEQGGSLGYTVEATNNTGCDWTFEYWSDVYLWTGEPYKENPVFGPKMVTVRAGVTKSGHLSHRVPNSAPLKAYTLCGRIGFHPDDVWDEDCFEFTVVEGTTRSNEGADWEVIEGTF